MPESSSIPTENLDCVERKWNLIRKILVHERSQEV